MLSGAFFAVWGSDVTGAGARAPHRDRRRWSLWRSSTRSSRSRCAADQIVGGTAINFLALGITTYLFLKIYGEQGTPTDLSTIPDVHLGFLADIPASEASCATSSAVSTS